MYIEFKAHALALKKFFQLHTAYKTARSLDDVITDNLLASAVSMPAEYPSYTVFYLQIMFFITFKAVRKLPSIKPWKSE